MTAPCSCPFHAGGLWAGFVSVFILSSRGKVVARNLYPGSYHSMAFAASERRIFGKITMPIDIRRSFKEASLGLAQPEALVVPTCCAGDDEHPGHVHDR